MTNPFRHYWPRLASLLALLAGAFLLAGTMQRAHAQRVALGTRASTLGIGADATVGLTSTLNLRVGGSYFPVQRSGVMRTEVDVRYDVTARLAAGLLLLDWHPFDNALRLSAGGVYNASRIQGEARPTESHTVQGKTFSPERLGRLDAEASFRNTIAPYVGVGFGNAVRGSRLDLFFDLGAMYVNRPEVQMSGRGLIAATSNHESTLNRGLQSFHILPYISLGLSYLL
ncbi:MAG TPA: hypothetical protein VJ884_03815 [Salinibacter sp.]|nr:hypothetical protein [Salinibacter sp.]